MRIPLTQLTVQKNIFMEKMEKKEKQVKGSIFIREE